MKCLSLCRGLDDEPGLIYFSGIPFSLRILGEGQTRDAFLLGGDSEWAAALGQVFLCPLPVAELCYSWPTYSTSLSLRDPQMGAMQLV